LTVSTRIPVTSF